MLACDAIEAECRQKMATRAAIKLRYDTREVRAHLLAEINDELDDFNRLVLGR
jgi:hypothetical protein